ncbi:hypothetical protein CARUB_v10005370mg [Capsella rubella]|uniref:Uncharacterized protein n=1 Tax=Capsella rubella TaxID=81985 RepID=R0F6H5_9BRAS|nr:uncharacterized protein LOC17880701 [Capsella rubella]EOA17111.1 hypothetical protein CARUB_v10005370mg [Capsella rubella]
MEENGRGGGGSISNNGVVVKKEGLGFSNRGIKIENPFAFKALQVFTGFGVGCGVGIGSGAPLNLGSIPMVGEVMSSSRGATNVFSGATHHVNSALRKLGARNIVAGVGCGVGFGHGFGVGIAVKPSAIHKLQASIMETASNLMTKLGRTSETISSQTENEDQVSRSVTGHKKHVDTETSYKKNATSTDSRTFGTRTEKVINSFLDNPILKQQDTTAEERQVTQLESESLMLQMVLKHQKLIDEVMEENEKLRRIIIEDLKVSPEKLKLVSSYNYETPPCKDCFECRRKQRRNRGRKL